MNDDTSSFFWVVYILSGFVIILFASIFLTRLFKRKISLQKTEVYVAIVILVIAIVAAIIV